MYLSWRSAEIGIEGTQDSFFYIFMMGETLEILLAPFSPPFIFPTFSMPSFSVAAKFIFSLVAYRTSNSFSISVLPATITSSPLCSKGSVQVS